MRRQPSGQWNQFEGKAAAELKCGSGRCVIQPHPCQLEPPFHAYDRQIVTAWDCINNDWEADWQGRYVFNPDEPYLLPYVEQYEDDTNLAYVSVEQFAEDEATIDKAVQLLFSLPHPKRPVAFEVVGMGSQAQYDSHLLKQIYQDRAAGNKNRTTSDAIIGWDDPYTAIQFTCHRDDADTLANQLTAHYPNSAVRVVGWADEALNRLNAGLETGRDGYGAILALEMPYCFPLKTFTRLATDPLALAIAAMEHLDKREWAVLQILFEQANNDWGSNLRQAVQHPYKPKEQLFSDITERDVDRKLTSPLFAVSVRLMASQRPVYDHLLGWANQFADPPQAFIPVGEDKLGELSSAIKYRYPNQPGLLLNTEELASLVHLPAPSITSDRLRRVTTRTKAAPNIKAEPDTVALGINTHRGIDTTARISAQLRGRHCYIAGASGTGKSTLLLNMIQQDIRAGAGVGVIDPHGDLIEGVLSLVPKERVNDVAYFNPTDRAWPPGLNILSAHGADDRQRVVTETVATIRKFFPDAWGPRLQHILLHALSTIVQFKGATLWQLRQLLTDPHFRSRCVAKLSDDSLLNFWHTEFPSLPKGSIDPILNKLSPFLLNPTIRNIVCQPRSTFDFPHLLNNKKIFLANLSSGLLTPQIAGVLGTFLMGKIVSAAFARAAIPEHQRQPFYLYVDEFQNFMDLSVGFEQILSEARKYKLVLAGMANQYVAQLSDPVRQAIFGNVGTLLTFRLGVEDASRIAREFGEFTADELMALERGQAICRLGGIQTSFNLNTPPPPDSEPEQIKQYIIKRTRREYTIARDRIEQLFRTAPAEQSPAPAPPAAQPAPPTASTTTAPAVEDKPSPSPAAEFTPDDLDDFTS